MAPQAELVQKVKKYQHGFVLDPYVLRDHSHMTSTKLDPPLSAFWV